MLHTRDATACFRAPLGALGILRRVSTANLPAHVYSVAVTVDAALTL